MPITATNWTRLLQPMLTRVPAAPGVFEIATVHRETIFFGSAENLQVRLGQMLGMSFRHPCLSRAWHFRFEQTPDQAGRLQELIKEYQTDNGQLPVCMQATTPVS